MYTHLDIVQALKKISSKEKALSSARFFKTAPGQYGYGDVFIGVTVPEQRKIAKAFRDLPLMEITKLLESKIHEHRLTALEILTMQFEKGDLKTQEKLVRFYVKHLKHINNWDLVDTSASYILGKYLVDQDRKILYKLAQSKNLWERRIAIVSTHAFIARGDFVDTLAISEIFLHDVHDLIHKACGWMLREVGKKDEVVLKKFLNKHVSRMPRTMLRYAIERLSKDERKKYLLKK